MSRMLGQRSNELGHLARHMTRIMDKTFRSHFPIGPAQPDWHPAVDFCELADGYEIIVDLAGIKKEDIHVCTEGSTLIIRGWRRDPCPSGKVEMHQMEIEQGRFQRRVTLPPDASCEGVTARYRNGLLRINIMKR